MTPNRRERRAAPRTADRYGRRARRPALAPAVVEAIVLLAGLALLGTSGFLLIRYAVSILALIIVVFVFQTRRYWWLPIPVAVAVLWNPVYPFDFTGRGWTIAQFLAALALLLVGLLVRAPEARRR